MNRQEVEIGVEPSEDRSDLTKLGEVGSRGSEEMRTKEGERRRKSASPLARLVYQPTRDSPVRASVFESTLIQSESKGYHLSDGLHGVLEKKRKRRRVHVSIV